MSKRLYIDGRRRRWWHRKPPNDGTFHHYAWVTSRPWWRRLLRTKEGQQ